ncbi:choice-of-anchor V domain-containing protein [Lewinella sp. W8]|uniref:choice-of-anchor V domain-containing protein n=1 Tax=Lewinella sp. W8 TaxID=2528208 RepID=UPI0010676EC1|nr:choice-of-anchor V domain-containing protein [Lewinella sp. W8]MTB51381.1 T9SS type A sorting domain-containing protein [Lewinella sp. W8]
MKKFDFRILSAGLGLALFFLLLGNSSGPAANGNYYTGAPTAGGGMESTCSTCHSSGSFGEPNIQVSFALDGEEPGLASGYLPGETYTVTVAIGHNETAPAGYGFQAQFLDTLERPATAGVLSMPSDNAQITPGNGDRVYAEHSTRSTDSTFTFQWTAPEEGSGPVNLYVVGNLVNGAQGTVGDNGSSSPTIVRLAEEQSTSVRALASIPFRLFPNPSTGPTTLQVIPRVAGTYDLRLRSLDGRVVRQERLQLNAGSHRLSLPTEGLVPGFYGVELSGQNSRLISKLILN